MTGRGAALRYVTYTHCPIRSVAYVYRLLP